MSPVRVLIWNEGIHEKENPEVSALYPEGIHGALLEGLLNPEKYEIRTATLADPEHGLSEKALAETDVLIWWSHIGNHLISDEEANCVTTRIREGMGAIFLHSARLSKPFIQLMGTSCRARWRESNDRERLWVVEPGHPIARGIPPYAELGEGETYGERMDIPAPEELVFLSWFSGGEVLRSGCCFHRGAGRIFYFSPGHETTRVFRNPVYLQILKNAVDWAAPAEIVPPVYGCCPSPEKK